MAFAVNRQGITQMLVMPGILADMGRRAGLVAARAKETAPVDETGSHPGQYRDSITTRTLIRPRDEDPPRARRKAPRACGRVTASAPESLLVEFGTEKQDAHRTLRDALDVAGD
ncbi:hypothetical protein KIH74_22920 [Kineosporia sp. J2-2]|uniref:Transposase n=1 Tax=Kineosporia corallincola TaxID=2835133 RepID=A0ABS5TL33_9ACTN|nr:hypothetical protein [Kineosporia corallincola]MBT0771812.1 hypothetical protein [Kineosporia corallincola]